MPEIQPIKAITYTHQPREDISDRIAPPYDVLDETSKAELLQRSEHNIVAVDLPHLPPKTVGPDATYEQAGQRWRSWLEQHVLHRADQPAFFAYRQTYTVNGQQLQRKGLIANVLAQPFGPGPEGKGGVYAHEETFSAPKEDRLKLMRATQAQLSPIFGLYSDPDHASTDLLDKVSASADPDFQATSPNDGVLHEAWRVSDPALIQQFQNLIGPKDAFIADGHHRYNTALNYRQEREQAGQPVGGASHCLFVLVAIQDPGMIVLPTHRVLGNMPNYSMRALMQAGEGNLQFTPVPGEDLGALEEALASHDQPHVIGLYDPTHTESPLMLAQPLYPDPLKADFSDRSPAWRALDVALVQHLLVEHLCQPNFCQPGDSVTWKFPHTLQQVQQELADPDHQLGVILRATPLDAVRQVSEAGDLMPQKSTFFYPKLATGLVMNPVE